MTRSVIHPNRKTVTTAGTNDIIFDVNREMRLKQVEAYNETTASRVSVAVEASREGGARVCGLGAALSFVTWHGDLKLQPPQIVTCNFVQCVVGDKLNFHLIVEIEEEEAKP